MYKNITGNNWKTRYERWYNDNRSNGFSHTALSPSRYELITGDIRTCTEKKVILPPGQKWKPSSDKPKAENSKRLDPKDCKYHNWVKVTLFRFDVHECSKCGVKRDD